MLLPTPLPDELFVSVLARLGRLNGMRDLREVAERCCGLQACSSFIDARLILPEFCERINNAYGEPDKLLEQLTTLGARRSIGEIDEAAWNSLVYGESSISVGELIFHGVMELRFCPSCREADIDREGIAYWHRMHQMPILRCCVVHGDRLKKAVIKRVALHQSFPLPGDFSGEAGVDLPLAWSNSFEIELGKFSKALLTQQRPSQGLLEQALLEGLRQQKILTSNGGLRTGDLSDLFIYLSHRSESPVGRSFRQVVRGIREPERGVAFGRALLLCALFGDWRIAEENCKWVEVLGRGDRNVVRDPHDFEMGQPSMRERHREKCRAYIFNDLSYSRLGFTKQNYRSFRWLLHNDKVWLDNHLPVLERDMEQLALF